MDDFSQDGSPYIDNIALQPPSPPIPAFDYNQAIGSPGFAPANFPNSASYNSPFSNHSELSFDEEPSLALFDDQIDSRSDYNPTDFDTRTYGSSLLMFNDGEYIPSYDQSSQYGAPSSADFRRGSFDHGSPSSNGAGGDNSRRSSISSHHNIGASPRMDVQPLFESLTFQSNSPSWGTEPLPRDGRSPELGQPKAPSPPRLMMPENQQDFPQPPMINAPEGDGTDNGGPSVRIVPATPVSGGGVGGSGVPFQTTLHTLSQGQCLSNFFLLSLPFLTSSI
ncbi:hypothetical protein DL96DRAFT_1469742 [Flagelloscypha sp. PMI_526]|nr:hypothetical protein DL96DRAFT_1469742 [Flagelloscypha sp. PMI_526]